eukprot:CCRYP_003334-RA/>CCRYP_003334-RA protein AED:0.00 eAED:0.00 QI:209/1/1/1/1/1/2/185/961
MAAASSLDSTSSSSDPNTNTNIASSLPHTNHNLIPTTTHHTTHKQDHTAPPRRSSRGFLSKLSSRNRRRRREKVVVEEEERIPIPSFSFPPAVANEEYLAVDDEDDARDVGGGAATADGGGNRCESHVDGRMALDSAKITAHSNEERLGVPVPLVGGWDGKENNPDSQSYFSNGNSLMKNRVEKTGNAVSRDGHGEDPMQTKYCIEKDKKINRLMGNATINDCSLWKQKDSSLSTSSSHVQSRAGSKSSVTEEDSFIKSGNNNVNSKKRKCEDQGTVEGSIDSTKLQVWSEEKIEDESSSHHAQVVVSSSSAYDTAMAPERNTAANRSQSNFRLESKRAGNFNADGSHDSVNVSVAANANGTAVTSSTAPIFNDQTPSSHHTTELKSDDPTKESIHSSSLHVQDAKHDGNAGSSSEIEVLPSLPVKPSQPKGRKSEESTSKTYSKNADASALGLKRIEKPAVPRQATRRTKPKLSRRSSDVIEIDCSSTSSSSSSDFSMNRPTRKHSHKNGNRHSKKEKSGNTADTKLKSKSNVASSSRPVSKASTKETAHREKTTNPLKRKHTPNHETSKSSERKKLCFACSSCKCHSRDGTSATPKKHTSLATLSTSHARQEQALIHRLQRIERNVQWMESQKADVGRQLIKHRNAMTKKWEEQNPKSLTDRPKFLADVDEWDGIERNRVMEEEEVRRATAWTFGKDKTRSARKITLTQHFGPTSKSESSPTKSIGSHDGDEEHETSSCVDINNPFKEEPDSDEEELKQQRAIAHLTSMSDFNDAIACSKQKNRVSSWEAATVGPISSLIDDIVASPCSTDGIDELLRLFSSTQHTSDATPACLQKELDDASDNQNVAMRSPSPSLTPRGERIAEDIKTSLMHEPTKLTAIERVCPKWKENVEFAQLQTDPEQVRDALVAVREAKSNIDRIKDTILQVLMDRQHTLELFEQSLERSLDRLETTDIISSK